MSLLRAVLSAALAPTQGAVVEPDRPTARQLVVQELTGREYTQANLLQRAITWVGDRLTGLLSDLDGVSSLTGLVIGAVAVVVVIVLALLLAGPLRRVARSRAPREADVFGGTIRSAAEHRADAVRAAGQQQWALAVQERFRAAARTLEERVVLDPRPGRTAEEVAVEGGAVLPDAASPLRSAARAFEDVTYGERAGDEAGYQRCVEADQLVQRARPRGLLAVTPAGADR